MEEKSQDALDVLRKDDQVFWVVEQVADSFAEGIAQSAKDDAEVNVPAREKVKRQKYETSRPYQESEKVDLIRFALQQVFVVIPELQTANAKWLRDLGSAATTIEFDAPDEEERKQGSYALPLDPGRERTVDLSRRFTEFDKILTP